MYPARSASRVAAAWNSPAAATFSSSCLNGPHALTTALGSARGELDRFAELQRQIVALSRRNTNVRSLAVTLGRKRRLTAACDETLAALQESLAKHAWRATR